MNNIGFNVQKFNNLTNRRRWFRVFDALFKPKKVNYPPAKKVDYPQPNKRF